MRISDWSSDVCSSDLRRWHTPGRDRPAGCRADRLGYGGCAGRGADRPARPAGKVDRPGNPDQWPGAVLRAGTWSAADRKSVVSGKSVSVRVDLGCRRTLTQTMTLIVL